MALPVKNRLKKESDFKNVLKAGRVYRGGFVFIKVLAGGVFPRFGISVPAKVSPKAVNRNHIRRVLSQVIQLNVLPKGAGYDTVIVVTKSAPDQEMSRDLLDTFKRASLI